MMTRRSVVFSPILTLLPCRALLAGQFEQLPNPQRNPALTGRPVPKGSGNGEPAPGPDPKQIMRENQKELRREVEQLMQLAQDMKTESDVTAETNTLSVTFLRKADNLVKLARQIKSLAQAS